MERSVLVTYATKHGSTAEIAVGIAKVLRDEGFEAEVVPVKEVVSLAPYGAVVLGSAAYFGRWRGEAVRFLKRRCGELAVRSTWLFMSGPTGKGDPKELLKGKLYPESIQPTLDRVRPKEVACFHGNASPDNFSGWEKWILKRVGADAADFRDWDMINGWARKVAGALKKG